MKDNELVRKITNNKILLFIIPNLIYISTLLNYYNINFLEYGEVFFSEVIFLSLFFILFTVVIYGFLCKCLKDRHKVFCILTFICSFYFKKLSLIYLLVFVVFILVLIIMFKKFIIFKLDYIVVMLSFIIFFLFAYNFVIAGSNALYAVINSKCYDYDISIDIKDNTNTPNIYWIHCDGMTGISAMKDYFRFDNTYLINYFNDNNFYVNEDATLVAAHQTQEALVAMFNPYYYDNFFKDYLLDLEETYLGNNKKTSFIVDYYELEEKRLNNELFSALDKKDYTTVAIADFNPYTAFYTDYYYDFYQFGENVRSIDPNNSDLRLLGDNSQSKLLSYIRFTHLKSLINRSIFYGISDVNYLDYEVIDYNSFDSSNYQYIDNAMNNSNFWLTKAIIKGLDDSTKIDSQKFVFVDFKLAHDPFTFDRNGMILDEQYKLYVGAYLGNYIYSTYLLVDLLKYIKTTDKDAIIMVQADHGLHTVNNDIMQDYFSTNMNGVQEIRNSVLSAYYIPDKYKNGDEEYLNNPLNVSRYIVNNYVGNNYEYVE